MTKYRLELSCRLSTSLKEVWNWITSFEGINTELAPLASMTAPRDIRNISDTDIVLGKPMFRSWVKLFRLLPIDYLDLTLIEIEEEVGFIEQSNMSTMKIWKHERKISVAGIGTVLTDILIFEPKIFEKLAESIMSILFNNRHKNLRRHFGEQA